MANTKIVKNSDYSIASEYPESANQSNYGGPWGDVTQYTHVEVPNGMDKDVVEAYLKAASGADNEGVNYTADTAGESGNSIILNFNGSDDIDTVVNNYNTNNPSNTVSHDGTGTDVPTAASVQLSGGGIALREVQAQLDAKIQAGRDAKLAELRKQRDEKALEADHELNKHYDADTNKVGLEADWKTYRIALRDITVSYKDGNGDGTPALDAFADDMSDFSGWPVKPS